VDSLAWYNNNSGSKTHAVGQKMPNGLGIYDMSGNVWELVSDWYDEYYYQNSPKDNVKGPDSGRVHVLRGGGWLSYPRRIRSASRGSFTPDKREDDVGFPLMRTKLEGGGISLLENANSKQMD
jgi:sulfatase modifying factor 1